MILGPFRGSEEDFESLLRGVDEGEEKIMVTLLGLKGPTALALQGRTVGMRALLRELHSCSPREECK